MMRFIPFIWFFICTLSFAQIIYEPLHKDVYQFLGRLSQKGIVDFDDQIKPLSRIYIAERLIDATEKEIWLTVLEKEELDFYLVDFVRELEIIRKKNISEPELNYLGKDRAGRYRLFSYSDKKFSLNISPIIGLKIGSRDEESLIHFWNGIYMNGYLTSNLGFSFDFRDNLEKGNTIDKFKNFTSVTGTNERSDANIIDYSSDKVEYSEVKTVVAVNWEWGSAAVGKEFFEWGYGQGGKLVLSQKAPSFPFIRLDIHPVDWFSFNYIHAWLSSDIMDSSDIYYSLIGQERYSFREKYLASHTINIKPLQGLSISVGESIVYSDKLELVYLIPIMFFRLADHHLSRHYNAAGSNAQLFASVSSRNHIPNTHIYGTLFIDEITITNIFDSYKQRNQFGFSFGGSVVDLPVDNLDFTAEFTKIYPFVYEHYIASTTYKSASYVLGHWMGQNADQIYLSLEYRFKRGLIAKLWSQYIRKGEDSNIEQQYVQPQPPFLYGLRKNYTYFGGYVQYELLHELFTKFEYQMTKSSIQQENGSFVNKAVDELYISFYYGL